MRLSEVRILLTVEAEVNGASKSTNERDFPLVAYCTCLSGTRDFCSALAALVGPEQNICFLTLHSISIPLSPSPSKLGRQPC